MTPGTPVIYRPTQGEPRRGVVTGTTKSGRIHVQGDSPRPWHACTKPERLTPLTVKPV